MAQVGWDNGAGTRNAGTAANYVPFAGGADALPVSNDQLYFNSTVTGANTGPNTNMSALTAVDLNLLEITPDYTEDIGTVGAPFDISSDIVRHYGQGTLYYKDGAGTTDYILVDVDRRATFTESGGKTSLQLSGATTSAVAVRRGKFVLEASSTVTDILLGSDGLSLPDIISAIGTGCTLATFEQFSGSTGSDSSFSGICRVRGGIFTQKTVVTNGALHVYPGARVNLTVAGTYPLIVWHGGIIDGTVGGPKTITQLRKTFKNETDGNQLLGYSGTEGLVQVTAWGN